MLFRSNGFGDEAPDVQWDNANMDGTQFVDDTITLSGKVLSGSETGEVYVEAAFFLDNLSASAAIKYQLGQQDLWKKSDNLSDGENFELTLDMSSFYTNEPVTRTVFLKYYEGTYPNERWVTIKWIELDLPACQGLEANPQALEAGGEFVIDSNGDCQWNGAWSYDPVTGEWTEPQSTEGGDAAAGGLDPMMLIIGGAVLVIIIVASLMFMRRGDEKDDAFAGMEGAFGADALDPTEQYVQQLIAQGYPEETARAFAAQYVGGGAAQPAAQPAAAQPAAAQPAAGYDQAVYEQYYQQFMSQGYDAATAAAYAQQYAVQYAQSQQ